VYGALVPANRFQPASGDLDKQISLGRANAAKFVKRLCLYPGDPKVIAEAERHVIEAHAERLTYETGKKVTAGDIVAGRAPRPKVLDMFAGGGAIPLEALRLGCDAYALDLNPVAHIIELCTLVYPQKYGKPDPTARGMTGPKGKDGNPTWGGLADEVRHWGNWILKKVKAEIGDLYPLIPDPEYKGKRPPVNTELWKKQDSDEVPPGYLMPVAYLWTRTVTCKNPKCRKTVPLVKQTWLCKKGGRCAALRIVAPMNARQVRFEVAEAKSAKDLGFDPEAGSRAGNATCPFCGSVADSDYVRMQGTAGHLGRQPTAVVCGRSGAKGRTYVSADDAQKAFAVESDMRQRLADLSARSGLSLPDEPIEANPRSMDVHNFGLVRWSDLFTTRQLLCLMSFSACVKELDLFPRACDPDRAKAVSTLLAFVVDRLADWNSSLCSWSPESTGGAKIGHTFGKHALPMVWDFAESAVWGDATGSAGLCLDWVIRGLSEVETHTAPAAVRRGSATALSWPAGEFDAVVTDPPYYDNISYSNLSDFFFVWLKRMVGRLYPEHFASVGTPKKSEIVAAFYRHGGDRGKARAAYEGMMGQAFTEATRALKPGAPMVVVYAHKTTLGWATLVGALMKAGFQVTEAWPLDTEMKVSLIAMNTAALVSSIFLVATKRVGEAPGRYDKVLPDLTDIVRERVTTLWKMGISGADLVIACVGAGLRAFTKYSKVEYANGEEVPAERFLADVETVVLETILARLSKEVGTSGGRYSLEGVDPATRFYILWRYTYRFAELDAGEAIVFANGTHVELDGQHSLTGGARALLEKKKGKYRLLDFSGRGDDDALGLPGDDGQAAPLVDRLHRVLWLMEHRPGQLPSFLRETRPNLEQLRLVAQALAGPALKGGELADVSPSAELTALAKLTANWRSIVEEGVLTRVEREERKTGQTRLDV
jgi:putative DNA methylase